MPEDLLLELEAPRPVSESLQSIEELAREAKGHAHAVALAVTGMKGSALTFENIWRRIIIDVAKGQTTEMQAVQPRLLGAFEERLFQLKVTLALARWLRELGNADIPDPDILLQEIRNMERLKANVFDRWQTADDLEDLAARDYPLTAADLDRIGPQRRAPASWYAEEGKPF
jgi:hypothetical protein